MFSIKKKKKKDHSEKKKTEEKQRKKNDVKKIENIVVVVVFVYVFRNRFFIKGEYKNICKYILVIALYITL